MQPSNDFINILKQELHYAHDDVILFMCQKYPQLLNFSSEFLSKATPGSILEHYLKTFEKQKYTGSGLFAHCFDCQHKTKIYNFDNWSCSNSKCNKQHFLD